MNDMKDNENYHRNYSNKEIKIAIRNALLTEYTNLVKDFSSWKEAVQVGGLGVYKTIDNIINDNSWHEVQKKFISDIRTNPKKLEAELAPLGLPNATIEDIKVAFVATVKMRNRIIRTLKELLGPVPSPSELKQYYNSKQLTSESIFKNERFKFLFKEETKI